MSTCRSCSGHCRNKWRRGLRRRGDLFRTIRRRAQPQNWLEMLNTYLPERYKADSAFVMDHRGRLSEQIDVVIYDRQYSPLLFKQDGVLYVPAESVYAVFDVKQDMRRQHIAARPRRQNRCGG